MIRVLTVAALAMAAAFSSASAQTSPGTVLITGASQGHGLAFVEDYAARGWRVIATARSPDTATDLNALAAKNPNVAVERLDITDFAQVDALAAKYRGTAIDVLNLNGAINTFRVGVKPFGPLDPAWLTQVLNTNVTAQLYVAEAFLEHVAASRQKKIAVMSAVGGSITNVRNSTAPAYRASKAALNMLMRNLSFDLAPRGIVTAAFCPGWIKTRMGGPTAPLEAPPSIAGIRRIIAELTPGTSGRFWLWTGELNPY